MRQSHKISKRGSIRFAVLAIMIAAFLAVTNFLNDSDVSANHPVLVEGNNAVNGPPGTMAAVPGQGGDYDGDGLVGVAEDTDNTTDRIFGTISGALLGLNGGANSNGHVIIVTSGRFPEQILIPNTAQGQAILNGVTIIEAAPGVQANIDAVLQGDPNNALRIAGPGIIINTDQIDRMVILRNLVIRNYTEGIQINGAARVQISQCRLDSNINFGIRATGTSRVTIVESNITASGMRFGAPNTPGSPNPGTGIRFEDQSSGAIIRSTISGNINAGISNASTLGITLFQNALADNRTNFAGPSLNAFRFVKEAGELEPSDLQIIKE